MLEESLEKGRIAPRNTSEQWRISNHAAIGAQPLAVDPSAVRTNQKSHGCGDTFERTEALQQIHLGQTRDQFFRFSIEKKLGRGRVRRNCVDADVSTAHFFRQNASFFSADITAN